MGSHWNTGRLIKEFSASWASNMDSEPSDRASLVAPMVESSKVRSRKSTGIAEMFSKVSRMIELKID